jgi:hypothetical protein
MGAFKSDSKEVRNMSKRFTLNKEDFKKILHNALVFAAPALLVLLADITKALPEWVAGVWLIVALYVVNVVVDALRKFIAGK